MHATPWDARPKITARTAAIILFAFLAAPAGAADPLCRNGGADTVIVGGSILTLAEKAPHAEALAICEDRILAIGTRAQIEHYFGPRTRRIDARGLTVMPGFVDAHAHVEGLAQYSRMVPIHIPPLHDVGEILGRLRERLGSTPPEEWVVGAGGWNQPLPTREQLDALAPDRPVVVRESAHMQVLNSRALALAGLHATATAPPGGVIERDPKTGEPTGRIREMAQVWESHIPVEDRATRMRRLEQVLRDYARLGVTTVSDFPTSDTIPLYQEMRDHGRLPIRLRLNPMVAGSPVSPADPALADALLRFGPRTGFGDTWLKVGCFKLFVDGDTDAALQYNPPGQHATFSGAARYTQQDLNALARRASIAGFQLCVHAVGDKAQDMALDAIEFAQTGATPGSRRHRIEHAGNAWNGATTPAVWRRMKDLGILPVMTPGWIALMAPTTDAAVASFPLHTMRAAGLRAPSSSDTLGSMPETMNPFFGVDELVTRATRNGAPNAASESVPVEDALRTYTIDSAYASFDDTILGTLEAGKLADIILVSADPSRVAPEKLREIRVLTTIVGGSVVYQSAGPQRSP